MQRPLSLSDQRVQRAMSLASDQAGVVSRRQLYAGGVTRAQVRANVRARRWRRVRSQAVAVHTGPLPPPARHWAAVFEAGPRAMLDGASALLASGIEHFTVDRIRVSVPRGGRVRRARGLDIRQTRRWSADDLAPGGVPRSRPEVAAVRAALWARSDKQAALLLTMTVQQGLATAEAIGVEMLRIRRDRRRAFVHAVILDLIGGVRSLGELDVALECRRRGLPEPSRQVVRRTPTGTYYLDLFWERWGLVVEVDGIHHSWAQQVVGDALRQNACSRKRHRVAPDEFFAQIEAALVAAGWNAVAGRPA